jgi:hypothetical protein
MLLEAAISSWLQARPGIGQKFENLKASRRTTYPQKALRANLRWRLRSVLLLRWGLLLSRRLLGPKRHFVRRSEISAIENSGSGSRAPAARFPFSTRWSEQ